MTEAEIIKRQRPSSAKEIAKRFLRHENAVLIMVLAVLIGVFAVVTRGKSLTASNVTNVLVQSSARGMASIGQAFVILTAGIDLAPTGLAIMATCLGGWSMTRAAYGPIPTGPELPLMMGLLIIVLVGVGVGAANGSLVSRMGMPPLIVTLAMWQITLGLTLRLTGGFTITGLPEGLAFFGQGRIAGIPVPIIEFAISIALAYYILNHTTFGRSVYAVGGNPVSAWLSGINVRNTRFLVYVISGFTAALGGIILSGRVMGASLLVISNLELDSIAAVVIGGVSLAGGRGSIIGVLIGVIIIGVINNGMNLMGLLPGFQDVARGAIIVGAVAADTLRRRRG